MAQRRMLSLKIVDAARFVKMPQSARLLYYDLNIRADDDGIVEAWNVMKITGSAEDDLKVLAAKGFVKVLDDDLVTHILDWKEHNLIRPDRKVDSIYKDLLVRVVPGIELIESRQRADLKKKEQLEQEENGQPVDVQWTAGGQAMDGIGKVRLGQVSVSLGEDKLDQDIKTLVPICKPIGEIAPKRQSFKPPTLEEVTEYCNLRSNNVDPNTFIDFYSSKGWLIGKNKMKDWKAAVRTWEKNRNTQASDNNGIRKPVNNYEKSVLALHNWTPPEGSR